MILEGTLVQICMAVLSLATIGLHLARKNRNEALMYGAQSLAVVMLMIASLTQEHSASLLLIAVAGITFVIKVILAPMFFMRLIKRHGVKFSASTYANQPETLGLIVLLLVFAGSGVFAPITSIVPGNHSYLVLSLAMMLVSIFLMVNRKGAMSQVVGVLSLENSIVAFAVLAGLEQSAVLQAGIVFDVSVWLIIAVTMVSLVFKHHGTLDVTNLKKLRD